MKKKVFKGWAPDNEGENEILQAIEWECENMIYPTKRQLISDCRVLGAKKYVITITVERVK